MDVNEQPLSPSEQADASALAAAESHGATFSMGGLSVTEPAQQDVQTEPSSTEQLTDNEDGQTLSEALESAKALEGQFKDSGVTLDTLQAEWDANGSISADSYTKLGQAGFNKQMVDTFVEGMRAAADRFTASIYRTVGGEESFKQLSAWAYVNLPAEEINAYNRAVQGGDSATTKMMLAGIKTRYEAANGTANPTLTGNAAGSSARGYSSAEEMRKDMSDPRYKSGDTKWHAYVRERLVASDALL